MDPEAWIQRVGSPPACGVCRIAPPGVAAERRRAGTITPSVGTNHLKRVMTFRFGVTKGPLAAEGYQPDDGWRLTAGAHSPDSAAMELRPRAPLSWPLVLVVATLLGAFSTSIAYGYLYNEERPLLTAAYLNFVYWYAWAALVPAIVALARRFPLARHAWTRALFVHVPAAFVCSLVHVVTTVSSRLLLPAAAAPRVPWLVQVQRGLLDIDWEMVTYWAIVGTVYAVEYHREAQERALRASRLETELVRAQLQVLQSQLHPHFLFNTLHAISALVHRDADEADRTIARLSHLLRQSLDKTGVQEIPLKEELDFVQKYVEIEQVRFPDRLAVSFDVEPVVLDALVPSFVLQPLVENAIVHGVTPLGGQGRIAVAAHRDGDRLRLEVRDNGAGPGPEGVPSPGAGIGLSNTRQRLEHLYGARHRLEFSRRADSGLTVSLTIPLAWSAPVGGVGEQA
jgi:two-component system LytT family sensor kinase